MLRILRAHTAHELDRLRSRWESCKSAAGSVFQTYKWAQMAAIVFAAVEAPLVVAAESDAGFAIIPAALCRGTRAMGLLGETLFDYRNVIHSGDRNVLRRAWSELALLEAPLGVTALRGEREREEWGEFAPEFFCNAPAVRCRDISPEQFLAAHTRLGRQSRRLRKSGVSLRHHDGSDSRLISWIYERKGTQEGSVFAEPRRREFMVRICAAAPAACDVFTYESETECVAALVTFRHETTRHFYTVYFNPAWAQYSPGQVLVYEATAASLEEGLDCDYMTGEYPYKNRLATHMVPLFKVQASAERIAEVAGLRAAPAAQAA